MANDPIPKFPVAVATVTFVGGFIYGFLRLQATHAEYSLFETFMLAAGVALTVAPVVGFFAGAAMYFLKLAYKRHRHIGDEEAG